MADFVNIKKNDLLTNPSYIYFQKIARLLPPHWRIKIRHTDLPSLLDLIKWILIDLQRPQYFHPYGLYFFTGLPGTGKTIFMSKILLDYKRKFGNNLLIGTNYGFAFEDFKVNSYEDVIKLYDKPCIIGYDEIQNDFDARNWVNLQHAFSERITQSRKMNGLMILGTAQKFSFVDRRLRQLTHLVYECRTIRNRLTLARIYEPDIKEKLETGQFMETTALKNRGIKFFVQSDFIRSIYSSFQILESVKKRLEAEKSKPEQIVSGLRDLLINEKATL